MMSLTLFGLLLLFILLNIPIAFAIGLSSLVYVLVNDMSLALVAQRATMGVYSYPFLALPLFVFAGVLMEQGGITRRLMRFANALIGHIRGGLASVTVVSSALFGTMSGSALGVTAAIGSILIPQMKKYNYPSPFSAALQGCSGILGSLIPPSLTMVILGATGGISIGGLLIGGLIPGIILTVLLVIVSVIISRRQGFGKGEKAPFSELTISFIHSIPPLLLPVIILGGILGGVVTVTEAAVLAVIYAFLLSVVVYRELPIKKIPQTTVQVTLISVPVLIIIGISNLFGWIITIEQVPQHITSFFVNVAPNEWVFLILISAFLLFLGTFMESNALIIILIPILMPVVMHYGIDPIHFGVLFVVNLCIGSNTPPLGVTLMTASKIGGVNIMESSKAVIPFLIAMVIVLILTIFIPQLSTFLPQLFY
ncbi:TRAP transporter large permease [Virgibacillus byunsanensis]|uniref:TRAP transporter large permease n=1 Tax=Virgibacillus byunsanensis TaxID=570945 RepID=A0ABW3LQ18_9BACI